MYTLTEEQLAYIIKIAHSCGCNFGMCKDEPTKIDASIQQVLDLVRTQCAPKWQTGLIPQPTGPASLYQYGYCLPCLIADLDANNRWHWIDPWPRGLAQPITEKWYIVEAILPTTSGTGDKM